LYKKVKDLFHEIDDDKIKVNEYRIFIELENTYTVRDIINVCKGNDLYYEFLIKIWVLPDKWEDRFLLYLQYNESNLEFEVAYIYPLDEKADKDYYDFHAIDELTKLNIIDGMVYIVEFYDRTNVNWKFIRDKHTRPQFNFTVANIFASDRYSKSGMTDDGEVERFYVKDDEKSSEWSVIEYHIKSGVFTIVTQDRKMNFYCEYDKRWRYLVDDVVCEDIGEVFDIYWESNL